MKRNKPLFRGIPNLEKSLTHLKGSDPVLSVLIENIGACFLLSRRKPQGFNTLFNSIISQQLSKPAAETILKRFYDLIKGQRLTPSLLLSIDNQALSKIGFSTRKIEYVKHLAYLVDTGELSFRKLIYMDDEGVISTLTQVRGIGRWTAEMYLLFAMNRPDVFPFDDIAILNAIKEIYSLNGRENLSEIENISNKWKPFRSIACWYLYAYVNRKILS